MASLEVWAPRAKHVSLVLDGCEVPMHARANGWWVATHAELVSGVQYGFRLDGGDVLPDPRSASQPNGAFALSELLHHDAFGWTDAAWRPPRLEEALVYEMHVGTFTPDGTFRAAEQKLTHLRALGVTHIEMMPVHQFPGDWGWGYDGVQLFAPFAGYGKPHDLKHFIDSAHALGIAVLLDVVHNHLGPRGNVLPQFGPYLLDGANTPWGPALNLAQRDSDVVRRFLIDNALMWLRDYHFDGLRLDAVDRLLDHSAYSFLEQLADEVAALATLLGRPLWLVAESDLNDPRLLRPSGAGGFGLHAQWSDDFHHALHAWLTRESVGYYSDYGALQHVAQVLTQGWRHIGAKSFFHGRPHGRTLEPAQKHQLFGYLQTHDQIGNRPDGRRFGHLVERAALKLAVALLFAAPFTPMLFQGEEWDATSPFFYFTQHDDAGLNRAVAAGRRRELRDFGWVFTDILDAHEASAFQRSKLNWDELGQHEHREMFDWYCKASACRRDHPSLRGDVASVEFDEIGRWLLLRRTDSLALFNFGTQSVRLPDAAGLDVWLSSHAELQRQGPDLVVPSGAALIVGRDR